MSEIRAVLAREIHDSRGTPTLEVELTLGETRAIASVPSGASVGTHEALELRDADGRGVTRALASVNEVIAEATRGKSFDQTSLDAYLNELDGTQNKSNLGANAILGVSLAFGRAKAAEAKTPLYAYIGSLAGRNSFTIPQPLFNVLNGGKHAAHGIDIQECMLAPIGIPTIGKKVEAIMNCIAALKELLERKGYATVMGDEGGFAPALPTNEEALELLVSAIARAGYSTDDMKLALDVAATSLLKGGAYVLHQAGEEKRMTEAELLAWYETLARAYPIISIEDGFAEDDLDGFVHMLESLGSRIAVVGDDLTVTSVKRIARVEQKQAANACIIKPNQIGTLSEAVAAVSEARKAGWKVFASHRSGETLDTFISDFAVGLSCDYLKAGAPTREERNVKYTRLMEIEASLSSL